MFIVEMLVSAEDQEKKMQIGRVTKENESCITLLRQLVELLEPFPNAVVHKIKIVNTNNPNRRTKQ